MTMCYQQALGRVFYVQDLRKKGALETLGHTFTSEVSDTCAIDHFFVIGAYARFCFVHYILISNSAHAYHLPAHDPDPYN